MADDATVIDSGAAQPVATAQEPGEATPKTPVGPVDLTQFPEFRAYQATQDRRFAQVQGANNQLQQQLQDLSSRLTQREDQDISKLDPEERAQILADRLNRVQQQQQQQALTQRYQAKIAELVTGNGYAESWQKYPVLQSALGIGATQEGVDAVRDAIALIEKERRLAAEQKAA